MTVIFSAKSFFVVKFTLLISQKVVGIIRQNTNGGGQEPNVQWLTTFRTIKSRCCPSRPATQTAVRWDQQSRIASQRGTKTSVGSHARWEFPGPQTGFGPKSKVSSPKIQHTHKTKAKTSAFIKLPPYLSRISLPEQDFPSAENPVSSHFLTSFFQLYLFLHLGQSATITQQINWARIETIASYTRPPNVP